jgi:hypothetical protein
MSTIGIIIFSAVLLIPARIPKKKEMKTEIAKPIANLNRDNKSA